MLASMGLQAAGPSCCYVCLWPKGITEAPGRVVRCADWTSHSIFIHADCVSGQSGCPMCALSEEHEQAAVRLLSQQAKALLKASTQGPTAEQHKAYTRLYAAMGEVERLAGSRDDQVWVSLCASGLVGVVCGCLASKDEGLVSMAIHALHSLAKGRNGQACEVLVKEGAGEALTHVLRQHEQCKVLVCEASSLLSVLDPSGAGEVARDARHTPLVEVCCGVLPPASPRLAVLPLTGRHSCTSDTPSLPSPRAITSLCLPSSPTPASPRSASRSIPSPRLAFPSPHSSFSADPASSGSHLPPISPQSSLRSFPALSSSSNSLNVQSGSTKTFLLPLDSPFSPPPLVPCEPLTASPSEAVSAGGSEDEDIIGASASADQPRRPSRRHSCHVVRLSSSKSNPSLASDVPPPSPRLAGKASTPPPASPPPDPASPPSAPQALERRTSRRESAFTGRGMAGRRSQALLGIPSAVSNGEEAQGLALMVGGEPQLSQQSMHIRRASQRMSVSAASGHRPSVSGGGGSFVVAPGSMLEGARRASRIHRPSIVLSNADSAREPSSGEGSSRRPSQMGGHVQVQGSLSARPASTEQASQEGGPGGLRRSFSSPSPSPATSPAHGAGRGVAASRGPVLRVTSAIGAYDKGNDNGNGLSMQGLRGLSGFRSGYSSSRSSLSSTDGGDLGEVTEEDEQDGEW